jgi:hypothetical protein
MAAHILCRHNLHIYLEGSSQIRLGSGLVLAWSVLEGLGLFNSVGFLKLVVGTCSTGLVWSILEVN